MVFGFAVVRLRSISCTCGSGCINFSAAALDVKVAGSYGHAHTHQAAIDIPSQLLH